MKKIITLIANLKIYSKIWLCMVTIALTLSLFIGLFSSRYFLKLYQEDTYAQTADSLQIGSQALTDAYSNLLSNVISFATSPPFTQIVNDAHLDNNSNYSNYRALIQEPLSYLTFSSPLLDSAIVLEKNGTVYTLFTDSLKKEAHLSALFNCDTVSINGITWLPLVQSPMVKSTDIIPVILPISFFPNSRYLNVADSYDDADVFIILMLNSKDVAQRLSLSSSSYAERVLYLADANGKNINLPPEAAFFELAQKEEIISLIAANNQSGELALISDQHEYSIYSRPLGFCGLTLVEILPKTSLYHRMFRMNTFIFFIVMLGLAMAAGLSFLLSRFVTKPFNQLIQNVQDIQNNVYDIPHQMKYQDEIGRLNQAINSMHSTIQQQFEHIKDTERSKYHSEIQLLAEQINPHFLYNTLECINMEVMGGHKEAAEAMIRNLGDFLRIGLNYGNEVIPLSQELTHVKAYIDIMNYRFCKKVQLKCNVAQELQHISVLKLILQPLVENSIRHGFTLNNDFGDIIFMPEIQIDIFQKEHTLILEVSDNGHGIDVVKAEKSLYHKSSPDAQLNHVGLNNVYQRLSAYYGGVTISFETIPYYKNTIRLALLLPSASDSKSIPLTTKI